MRAIVISLVLSALLVVAINGFMRSVEGCHSRGGVLIQTATGRMCAVVRAAK